MNIASDPKVFGLPGLRPGSGQNDVGYELVLAQRGKQRRVPEAGLRGSTLVGVRNRGTEASAMFRNDMHRHGLSVIVVCAATLEPKTERREAILCLMAQLALRLATEIGCAQTSPILWDFRSRWTIIGELYHDDITGAATRRLFSLPELEELKTLAAVECNLLHPLQMDQWTANATSAASERSRPRRSNIVTT